MKPQMTEDEQFEQIMGLIKKTIQINKRIIRTIKSMKNPLQPNLKKLKNDQFRVESKIIKLKTKGNKLDSVIELNNKNLELLENEKVKIESQIIELENKEIKK